MGFFTDFSQSILVITGLIFIGYLAKEKGIFKKEHSELFAKIVTDFTLPALIFSSLAMQKISLSQMEQPLVMGAVEIICIALSWLAGSLLKLERPQKGAFILVSSFGSSALLGYPIIKQVFHGNPEAMADAAITSEFGVGIFIFTLGVIIAMYYGSGKMNLKDIPKVLKSFFYSPVFISLVAGMLASIIITNKKSELFLLLINFAKTLGDANTVLVVFSVGIVLNFQGFRSILPLALLACLLKLIIKPALVAFPAGFFGFPVLWKEVMVIEAAMPSAALAVVFAARYGCDGALASRLLLITLLFSIITMIGVAGILL